MNHETSRWVSYALKHSNFGELPDNRQWESRVHFLLPSRFQLGTMRTKFLALARAFRNFLSLPREPSEHRTLDFFFSHEALASIRRFTRNCDAGKCVRLFWDARPETVFIFRRASLRCGFYPTKVEQFSVWM